MIYSRMFFSLFFLSLLFSFSSCSMLTSSPKEEKHQLELSLHKLRTDVEDVKHDLNTYEIEHHVLEGKLMDQSQMLSSFKEQLAQFKQGKLQTLVDQLQQLEKNLQQLVSKQQQVAEDIRKLSSHANGTTTALSQYKMKIAELEKTLASQHIKIKEILDLKQKIAKLAAETTLDATTYVVKPGDSLGKIARAFHLSVESIKKQNALENDRIHPGQKLFLPSE